MTINDILNHEDILAYVAITLILLITYFFFARWVKKSNFNIDHKRRLLSNFRAFFTFSLVITALLLWSGEIYNIILPFTAVAAAFAIATKEFLLCIGGGFYKTFARPFSVGDRIEVDGSRGDVIEFGFLSTQLMEVGPKGLTHQYTGRSVTIPNSLFLTKNVVNETFSTDFVLHVFTIPISRDENFEKHKEAILKVANEKCEQYIDKGIRHFAKLAQKRQVESPKIHPRVNIKLEDPKTINLIVRITVPSQRRGTVEQEILNEYLKLVS